MTGVTDMNTPLPGASRSGPSKRSGGLVSGLLTVLAALASLAGAVWLIGMVIPPEHVASRSARFAAAPDTLWAVLGDLSGYARWAPDVKDVTRLADQNGRPVYALEGKWPMPLAIEVSEPPRRMVTRIADSELPFGGTWTWEIARDGRGSRVTVTERGEIKLPPLRAAARFVFGYSATLDAYLLALGRRFQETVVPEPAGS